MKTVFAQKYDSVVECERVTCAGFAVIVQGVSRQTEAVVGTGRALADVLTAVLRLHAQIHTCSGATQQVGEAAGPLSLPANPAAARHV